jgi:hypothetical protein
MKYEKYESLLISGDALEFKFISEGPKGKIQKVVQFIATSDAGIYNLAFGDLLPGGGVDDHIKNDNQDRNKILATVAATVYEFTARYPEKMVFFTGSTLGRTRLYRIDLTTNFEELEGDFEIYGVNLVRGAYFAEPFVKRKEYSGFLIKRKFD